jgi:hypothetical protein
MVTGVSVDGSSESDSSNLRFPTVTETTLKNSTRKRVGDPSRESWTSSGYALAKGRPK